MMATFELSLPTQAILNEINNLKLHQKDVAIMCALAIANNRDQVDWKAVNEAIVSRWSKSARERVLTMAWNIVEKWQEAQ